MLLMHIYFGVLDETNPLKLYDPTRTFSNFWDRPDMTTHANPLDKLTPTSVLPVEQLDPRSNNVRKMLKEAMNQLWHKDCTTQG